MEPMGTRTGVRRAAALASVLAPVPAAAHGPPEWLWWPTGGWFLLALFVLFAGTGAVAAARTSHTRRGQRERALTAKLASGLAACGAVLVALLAVQGPWSVPFAIAAALVASALGLLAFLATRPQRPGPP